MIIDTAERLKGTETYYFARKLKEIRAMNAEGKKVINLGIGSPDLPPAPPVIDALQQSAENPDVHGYQPYVGRPALREAIADYMQEHLQFSADPQREILPLMGSKEGIMHIAMAFLNPGDLMLIPDPGYPTYAAVGKLCQAKSLTYDLSAEDDWSPNLEELQKLPLDDVKVLWLNYPHMPTGAKGNREILEKLIALASRHQFLLVNDNPYNQLFTPPAFSIFQLPGARAVAMELHSMSKSHNMAGWRVGWLTGDADYINSVLKVKSNMDSGMFFSTQDAAIAALRLPIQYYEDLRSTYKNRRAIAQQLFDLLHCETDPEQEGLFLWGKVSEKYPSSEALSDELLLNAGVFITPGFIFGKGGAAYLRISLCASEEVLLQAVEKIKKTII